MKSMATVSATLAALTIATTAASAQSSQRWSAEVAPIYVVLLGNTFQGTKSALGFEGQLRYTASNLSIGAGVEYTKHGFTDASLAGFGLRRVGPFIEPRYVILIGSSKVAPYISARFSVVSISLVVPASQQGTIIPGTSTGTTINGGGGVLLHLAARLNLDLGATVGHTSFGTVKYSDGTTGGSLGSGGDLVVRGGLSFGF